jgi:hypothetical protein
LKTSDIGFNRAVKCFALLQTPKILMKKLIAVGLFLGSLSFAHATSVSGNIDFVPDSATTIGLLGASLAGLAMIRRKLGGK